MRNLFNSRLKRLAMGPLALIVAAVGMLTLGVGAASASSCVLGNPTNPTTGHVFTVKYYSVDVHNGANGNAALDRRAGCYVVWVEGDQTGYYRFKMAVQDTQDYGMNGVLNDDLGTTELWFQTPGASDWHLYGYDRNSSDFTPNEVCGDHGHIDPCTLGYGNFIGDANQVSIPYFNAATAGQPTQWKFKLVVWVHDNVNAVLGWQWHTVDPLKADNPWSVGASLG